MRPRGWFRHNGKVGEWAIDGEPSDVSDVRLCAQLEEATGGEVKFVKNDKGNTTIVERHVARIIDENPKGKDGIEAGFNPYTAFPGWRLHPEGPATPMTFTSTNWGGRWAVQRLMSQYVRRGRSFLPILALDSKERRDENGNWNPVFKVIAWVPPNKFMPELETLKIEAQDPVAEIEVKMATADPVVMHGSRLAGIIDDEVPW